jgi:hypothetical protein
MNERSPAFQFVMAIAMKQVGSRNGDASSGGLNGGKCGVIVYGVVGQKYFLAAAAAHI